MADEDCLLIPQPLAGVDEIDSAVLLCVDSADSRRLGAGGKCLHQHFFSLWQRSGDGGWVCGPVMGAPVAVMVLERLIASGAKRVILFGVCGSLTPALSVGDVLLPERAVAEEGTSSLYPGTSPPAAAPALVEQLAAALGGEGIDTARGPIWTTDAPYRETAAKVRAHAAQGVMAVDMECSALFTVAAYRRIELAAVLVVSDTLWDGVWRPGFKNKKMQRRRRRVGELLAACCPRL